MTKTIPSDIYIILVLIVTFTRPILAVNRQKTMNLDVFG